MTIIGAGIIGLATACELLSRHPRLRVLVLEKEPAIGLHQSGHNSGVIHSGVYYAPGSLRAALCVAGNHEIYRFCAMHGIPAERCGKVIVAKSQDELAQLDALHLRGQANGVEGIRLVDAAELHRIEPHCVGVRALLVPSTGITDYGQITEALAESVRMRGGAIRTGTRVTKVDERDGDVLVTTADGGRVEAGQVIVCAGLHSDSVGRMSGGHRAPAIIPFRGDYWLLRRNELVRHLIYPVPDPMLPFLGVHFTRRLDGSIWMGPNAVLALAREGYGRLTVDARELLVAMAYPGFRRLVQKHWRNGLREFVRDVSRSKLLKDLRHYIPELGLDDLVSGPSGVRAQAVAIDGTLLDDFVFEVPGARVLNVRNAPSPAATSCLTIARHIADKWSELVTR